MNWIRKNRVFATGLGIATALLLIGLLAACTSGSDQETAEDAPTSAQSATTATAPSTTMQPETSDPEDLRVGMAQLHCSELLTQDDRDEATGVWEREGDQGSFMYEKGEVCIETLSADESVFIRIEPGHPDDFGSGAQLEGMSAVSVEGIGDTARWFSGASSGILSVSKETSLGYLYYRIGLGRPDLDDDARLDLATTLALSALPRFPGVELEQPEPEFIDFEYEPVDMSDVSYESNLLAKEEAGEWTREEGLVATLKLFAGEIDQSQVLTHPDLVDYSGTGVVRLTQEYLATGADDGARAEIVRLLEDLFPTREQLGQMAGESSASGVHGSGASLSLFFRQEGESYCQEKYGIDPPCLQILTSAELEARWPGQYRVYAPVGEIAGGWDEARVTATLDALTKSVIDYSGFTAMPSIGIMMSSDDRVQSTAVAFYEPDCDIFVFPVMREFREDHYKQVIARDVAYCLIEEAFLTLSNWWTDGMVTYLGGWVYPNVNLEHGYLLNLESSELQTPLFDRYFDNWVFFEHLHPSLGPDGNLSLMSAVNAGGTDVLDGYWHPFNEQLTDASVPDIGSDVPLVPYEPPFENVQIKGPMEMTPHPERFAVARGQMIVESGKKACVDYKPNDTAVTSWRTGAVGVPGGAWSHDLPSELSDVSVFLVTATKDGAQLTMEVTKVVDEDKNCAGDLDESIDPPPEKCEPIICDPTRFIRDEAPGD